MDPRKRIIDGIEAREVRQKNPIRRLIEDARERADQQQQRFSSPVGNGRGSSDRSPNKSVLPAAISGGSRKEIREEVKKAPGWPGHKTFAQFCKVTEDQWKEWRYDKAHKDQSQIDIQIRAAAARWIRGER